GGKEAGLDHQPVGEAEGEGAGRGLALEDGGGRHVLHVVEQRLGEAAQVDESADVRLGHGAAQRFVLRPDLVLLVGQSLLDHVISPRGTPSPYPLSRGERGLRTLAPGRGEGRVRGSVHASTRYARRTSGLSARSRALPSSTMPPVSST